MRTSLLLASAVLAVPASGLVWACGNSNDNPNVIVGNDGSVEGGDAGGDSSIVIDTGVGQPDAASNVCVLSDHKTDPVALCIQEQALQFELQYAYVKGKGVASSWSSTAPYAAGQGHSVQDDLGLAGALGAYYCSSEVYGNNASTQAFGAVLQDLGAVLVPELQQTPPTGYDGETYFRLRWAQAAYYYANDSHADVIKAIANTYGAALLPQVYTVAASGGGDAGVGTGDGGAGEGGAAGNPGGLVIGTKNADGSVAYSPAQTVMAAAALLDMANLYAHDPDAGAAAYGWAQTAQQVLTYVIARGRDPVTGLYYQSLVTSGDPGHDAVGPGQPTSDTFRLEDQSWVMLGFARAQDLLATLPLVSPDGGEAGPGPVPVFDTAGANLAAALANDNLFDGTTSPSSPPQPGAFLEGLGPGGVLLTNKTTIGNSIMLGGLHRVAIGQGTVQAYTLGQTRAALTQLLPGKSSLLSIVTDSNGNPIQQSFLRAGSKGFDYAVAYGADGGAAGQEQGATDYRPDAVHAFVEGITQLWHGAANNPSCAP